MSISRKRLTLITGAVTCIVGLAVGMLLIRRIAAPTSEVPEQADVVVVLAGGQGERIVRALELMDDEVAPVLLISTGNERWRGWEEIAPRCERPQNYEVLCIRPNPDNTRGEASTIAALAEERGWQSLVLVTSTYHLHRATLNFERCFDGTIHPVEAPFPLSANLARHEALGILHAELIERNCA